MSHFITLVFTKENGTKEVKWVGGLVFPMGKI